MGRYICSLSQPTPSVYASVTSDGTSPSGTSLPSDLTISLDKVSYLAGETVVVMPDANNATYYAISIWLGAFGSGERVHYEEYIPLNGKVRFIPTQAGTYTIRMDARNSAGYTWAEKTFTVSQAHTTHTWDGGVITRQPTFDSTGVKTYTCTVCKETKTETVERLDSIAFQCNDGGARLLLTRDGHLRVTDENGIIGYIAEDGGFGNLLEYAEQNGLRMVDYKNLVTSISFGEGITTLGSHCDFNIFPNLTTVELPQSLTTIQNCAFAFCTSLQEINLPKNLTSLDGNAFQNCTSLRKITVSDQNPNYCRVDNVVYSKDMTRLICCAPGRSGNFVIPEGVNRIDGYAFFSCEKLNSVTIPRSVISIDDNAFVDGNINARFNATLRIYKGSYAETYIKELPKYIAEDINYEIIEECANGHTWDNGQVTTEATTTSTGIRTYTCTICGATTTETVSKLDDPRKKFTDLSPTGYYLEPVAWAVNGGVTTGKTTTTFAPNENCTHGQILTFLWRAAGEPASNVTTPFAMNGSEYYYGAAKWAYEKGMIGADFNHKTPCTRADAVNYIWQAFGKPAASYDGRFTDVPANSTYAAAVAWALANGVTTGATETTFNPNGICNRGQIVTFLYRAYKK